jgi:hypothetical protein
MALSPRPADKPEQRALVGKPHVARNFYDNPPSMTRNRRRWQFARTRGRSAARRLHRRDDPEWPLRS